ncbi:hypothetical protein BMT54_06510 [Pasteurellaceae bacterium 15-036681]|nr:hypothetical protein BMT54_06510 [Pasteurellaceae bacterium 15-036681]
MMTIIKDVIWAGAFGIKLFFACVMILGVILTIVLFDKTYPYILIALGVGFSFAIYESFFKKQ